MDLTRFLMSPVRLSVDDQGWGRMTELLLQVLAAQVQLGQPEHNASLESFLSRKLGVSLCTSCEGSSASVIILLNNMYLCMYI